MNMAAMRGKAFVAEARSRHYGRSRAHMRSGGDMHVKVIESWEASYEDPIRLKRGEAVHLTGQREAWDGHVWLWARSASGLEGWIPDNLVDEGAEMPVAKQDYSAAELTCQTGDVLVAEETTHGWVRCRRADGRVGWVPQKNLATEVS